MHELTMTRERRPVVVTADDFISELRGQVQSGYQDPEQRTGLGPHHDIASWGRYCARIKKNLVNCGLSEPEADQAILDNSTGVILFDETKYL